MHGGAQKIYKIVNVGWEERKFAVIAFSNDFCDGQYNLKSMSSYIFLLFLQTHQTGIDIDTFSYQAVSYR